ncbi:L-type lectin-domain containing receptor kinase S.4-like [Ananas comosus]|uniref:non-specific serine/threonine protein kinase n=2 Tax=Ananas comosus TaxID=4615 RepID=A0A6P5G1W6_ANACO|nr:L-type lectin-domain containing receptor kinase S.4-like [Ananas comosus]
MPKNLVVFFFSLLLSVAAQRDEFVYTGFGSGSGGANGGGANMSLNGIAEIEDSGILRLTNETTRLIGHAFYPTSLRFKNGTDGAVFSFSTAFAFAIVPEYPKLGGHGLAFTIATSKELAGALPSQYLGLLNASDVGNATNHVFAVEFDTVQDFEFGDINDNHVGIDLNNLASNASAAAAYYDGDGGTKSDLNLKSGDTIQGWVDYDGARKMLYVAISPSSTKPSKPLLAFPVDLAPILEERMYAGFSASTGLLASSHYLMGWSFKMNGAAQSLDLSSLPSLPRSKKKNTTFILATSFSAFVLLVGAAAAGAYLFYKVKNADVVEPWELCYGPHRYSYKELKRATRGFRDKQLLGFGGFGKVYKGTLPGSGAGAGAEVAVKRVSHESRQGIREFVAEIATIGRLRHRNLVQLQGWCRRRGDLLLVYDYMPNGSLDKYLFCDGTEEDEETQKRGGVGGRRRRLLTWAERFRILRGVASALLYLHEEWEHVVVHRDVKASNVLLDADLNGRLGDFGLAKLYEHGANPSTTRVVGTLGYLAPEMTRTGRATTASDVFAFGALALEAACGRRPIDPKAAPEELILVEWVWERWAAGRWAETVDARLGGDYDRDEAMVAIKVGLMCSHPAAAARPTMREVVRYLDGGDAAEMPEIRSPPPPGYEGAGKGHEGFDDFVHSYPSSSFEKLSASASPVAVGVGVGVGERAAVGPMGYSPLAQSQPHSDVTA